MNYVLEKYPRTSACVNGRLSVLLENSVEVGRAYALVLVPAILKAVPDGAACVDSRLNREAEMDLIRGQQMGMVRTVEFCSWNSGSFLGRVS